MKKRAIVVGVNDYGISSKIVPLKFAEADAEGMADVLEDLGFESELLVGDRATRANLFDMLVDPAADLLGPAGFASVHCKGSAAPHGIGLTRSPGRRG
ncbi:MAG: caspase family protein [Pseudomonadota bacterium]